MKAAVYEKFKEPLTIQNVPEPMPTKNSVVIKVEACGICRSDWHGWMGNDPGNTASGIGSGDTGVSTSLKLTGIIVVGNKFSVFGKDGKEICKGNL